MADALDMSLDDLITKNKSSSHNRRGRPRNPASASGSGGPTPNGRRFHARAATRAAAAPYHQLPFQQQAPPPYAYAAQPMALPVPSGVDTGTKLYISNLDYNVSNEDIKELFSEVGDLKRYSINYDKSGRSKGTAEVVFSRRSDALAALKRYNNVQLDGKPMKIEVIGTSIEEPAPPAPAIFAFNTPPPGNFNFPPKSASGRGGGGRGWPRGGGGFGRRGRGRGAVGRGRGRGGRGSQPVSADDLDADLDKYHSEAMQIS